MKRQYSKILCNYLCMCNVSLQSDPICIACLLKIKSHFFFCFCVPPFLLYISLLSLLFHDFSFKVSLFFWTKEKKRQKNKYCLCKIKLMTNIFFVFRFFIPMSDIREFQITWKRELFFKNKSTLLTAKYLIKKSIVIGNKKSID